MKTRIFVLPVLLWKHPKDEKPRRIAIVNRGTLFKSSLSEYEGKLKLFGGLVEEGEDELVALQREVNEELPEFEYTLMDCLECLKGNDSVFGSNYEGSHFETIVISDGPKAFKVRILNLVLNKCVYSTKDMYGLIAGCAEGNAEFYDIANRPFNSSEWVPFLATLGETFNSYNEASERA